MHLGMAFTMPGYLHLRKEKWNALINEITQYMLSPQDEDFKLLSSESKNSTYLMTLLSLTTMLPTGREVPETSL